MLRKHCTYYLGSTIEVLRAEYRAHPAYGDARFETPGNARPKTLRRLGISKRTYFRKLGRAKRYLAHYL